MLPAYVTLGPDHYKESFGLDFEDFRVGQRFRHRPGVTISQQENVDEALDTANSAMLHFDASYADKTQFGTCLVVSTLTLQKLFGMAWKTFARKDRITVFEDIAMTAPVFGGNTLYGETEILEIGECDGTTGELLARTQAVKPDGTCVSRVQYRIQIYCRGQHPYYGQFVADRTPGEERFAAFRQDTNDSFTEQVGLFFEDLLPGERFDHFPTKVISESEAREHAYRSLNWDPRHTSPTHARDWYGSECPPIPEIHWATALTTCTTRTLGRVVANLGWKNMTLSRHLFPGEEVEVSTQILEKRESSSRPDQGIVSVRNVAVDANGEEVCKFERTLLVYRKGHGPYDEAGY